MHRSSFLPPLFYISRLRHGQNIMMCDTFESLLSMILTTKYRSSYDYPLKKESTIDY